MPCKFNSASSRYLSQLAIWLLAFAALLCPAFATSSVNLAWDPSPDANVTSYRLKYGTSSGSYNQSMDIGNATTATVSNLTAGQTYYFVVTAFNSSALESQPSNEITFAVTVNQSPTVSITSPANGSSAIAPTTLTISANATDSDGTVSRVEFYNGSTKLGESTASPYAYSMNVSAAGSYVFTARAYDNQGASTQSASVTVTVTGSSSTVDSAISTVSYQQTGVQLTVTGAAGQTQSIYVSNDLRSWTLLNNVVNSTGSLTVNDPTAVNLNQRFYRVSDATKTSEPVGFTKLRVSGISGTQTSAYSYLGINLVSPTSYQGSVTSKGSQAIVDAQATWTDDQFNGANGSYYLEIVSGAAAGTTTDIVATNAASKTLTTDDDLSSLLSGGEQYRIRKHRTIGDVFGMNNTSGLKGGTSAASSDLVELFNPVSQSYLNYYFDTASSGWRSSTDAVADASGTKMYLDQGVTVCRKVAGDVTLIVTGAVKLGQTQVPIGSGSNLCANMYPAGTITLGNSGLYNGTTAGLVGSSKLSSADEVQIWSGSAFRTYYYKTGGAGGSGWRLSTNNKTDMSTTPIPVGSSIFVIRKNGRSAFNWKVNQPF